MIRKRLLGDIGELSGNIRYEQDTDVFVSTYWRVLLFYPFENKKKGFQKMKKIIKLTALSLTLLILCLCLISCSEDLWDNATYKTDTELGNGATTITVDVVYNEHTVKFTVKTDKTTLADALLENNLIEGEDSQYGIYIKKTNGIEVSDLSHTYWAIYIGNEMAMTGADGITIENGASYRLVYEKY